MGGSGVSKMTVYHQMGHDSINLVHDAHLAGYRGAILSPVNYSPDQILNQIRLYSTDNFEMILDPQLYQPRVQRGRLPEWPYFPQDFETADQSSLAWWANVIEAVFDTCRTSQPNAICSPTFVPRTFASNYYSFNAQIARLTAEILKPRSVDVLQTVIVNLPDLARADASAEIASIISGAEVSRVYLCLKAEVDPRRELSEVEEIKGAMRLIRLLEDAGLNVLVGNCSSDLILWKVAGATACAAGKYFNLRRFTMARWEEPPAKGGGQAPYWFEEDMMAFLRESDLVRVKEADLLSTVSLENPYGMEILNMIETDPEPKWLALGWRQFLYWFMDFDSRFPNRDGIVANQKLKAAEDVWLTLDDRGVLMDEARNDGAWLRAWRRAVLESFR
jgi:hypothetical protein